MQTETTQTTIQKMLTTSPPAFSEAGAMNIAASHFGITAEKIRPLVSERDQNFRLDTKQDKRFTLKISNEAEQESVVDFQNRALIHIAEKDTSIPLARVIPTLNGQLHCKVERAGKTHYVRILSWLDGMVLNETIADAKLANRLGRLLALLGLALKDFDHPGSNPPLLWDMKRAAGLRELVVHIQDSGLRKMISQTLDRFVSQLKPTLDTLRKQVIHNDMNPYNVLVDEARPDRIKGLIDFGDLVKSPLIIDLAVASAYQLSEGDDPLAGALPMIAGYHAVQPLQIKEMGLLTDLIRTRLITSLLIGSYRSILFPENSEYLLNSHHSAKNFLFSLSSLSADNAFERITSVCP